MGDKSHLELAGYAEREDAWRDDVRPGPVGREDVTIGALRREVVDIEVDRRIRPQPVGEAQVQRGEVFAIIDELGELRRVEADRRDDGIRVFARVVDIEGGAEIAPGVGQSEIGRAGRDARDLPGRAVDRSDLGSGKDEIALGRNQAEIAANREAFEGAG